MAGGIYRPQTRAEGLNVGICASAASAYTSLDVAGAARRFAPPAGEDGFPAGQRAVDHLKLAQDVQFNRVQPAIGLVLRYTPTPATSNSLHLVRLHCRLRHTWTCRVRCACREVLAAGRRDSASAGSASSVLGIEQVVVSVAVRTCSFITGMAFWSETQTPAPALDYVCGLQHSSNQNWGKRSGA